MGEFSDPMEMAVAQALTRAGIAFTHESEGVHAVPLDFYMPDFETYIEVKQFHSDRIGKQMASAPNVIAIQGREAVSIFCQMIAPGFIPFVGRLRNAARHQGQDEDTRTLAVIARIREVTGLGHRPMLSELAQAVADVIAAKSLDRSALIRTIGEFTPCTADDGIPCCEACHCSRLADRIIALTQPKKEG